MQFAGPQGGPGFPGAFPHGGPFGAPPFGNGPQFGGPVGHFPPGPFPGMPFGGPPGGIIPPSMMPTDSTQAQIVKTNSLAFQLSGCLVQDILANELGEAGISVLRAAEVTLLELDALPEDRLLNALQNLGVRVTPLRADAVALFPEFRPWQIIIVNSILEQSVPHAVVDMLAPKLRQFVANGGQLLSFNWAVRVLEAAFPDSIYSGPPLWTQQSSYMALATDVVLAEGDEVLLRGYNDELRKSSFTVPGGFCSVKADKEKVQVLLRAKQLGERSPLLTKFRFEQGTVYHMVAHLTSTRKGEEGMKTFDLPAFIAKHAASKVTQRVWECCKECGYGKAFPIAISCIPLIRFLGHYVIQAKKRLPEKKEDAPSQPPSETQNSAPFAAPVEINGTHGDNFSSPQQHEGPI